MISETVAIFHVVIVIKLILFVWINLFFTFLAWNQGRGSRYPGRGILTPTNLFVLKAQQILYDIKNCCILSCYSCNRINSIGLNKKTFSHIWLGIRGGGQDTPARVSWPPPTYLCLKGQQIPYDFKNCCSISCYSCNRINSIGMSKKNFFTYLAWNQGWGSRYPRRGILTPTQLFVFKSSINFTMISNCCILSCYHCDKIKSVGLNKNLFSSNFQNADLGGGQDTPAGVSWPPPSIIVRWCNKVPLILSNT